MRLRSTNVKTRHELWDMHEHIGDLVLTTVGYVFDCTDTEEFITMNQLIQITDIMETMQKQLTRVTG